jgi:hypothetical protein
MIQLYDQMLNVNTSTPARGGPVSTAGTAVVEALLQH